MTDTETDTERTAVRTYVPAYQCEEWDSHAEDLGMSRSEFVRTMVQAGRREFGAEESDAESGEDSTGAGDGADNRSDLETRVLDALESAEFLTWEELVGELTADIEQRLEATLDDLQSRDRVRYSGRNGGYTIRDEH